MQQNKELNIQMGSRIRKARLQAGLTQEAFAELLNLGPKHISAIERGIVGLSMETLQNICQVLHVSADTLLFGDIEKSPADTLCQRLGRLSPEELKKSSTKYWKFSQKNNRKKKFSFGFLFSNRNKKDGILSRLIFYRNPCICCCHCQPCVTSFRSSIQATLRHTRS